TGNRSAVYAESKGAGTGAKYGGYFEAKNGTGLNHGVYARATGTGNAYGVRSVANGQATNYGLYSVAQGNGTNYAVYGKALGLLAGLGSNYAIYGEVDASNLTGWAGYFKGRGYFSERVGIGTNNPGAYLHVNADDVTLPFAVQINGASKLKTNTNGSVSIGGVPSGPTNGLYVNGDVVIGTSTPAAGYKLSVNGKVMCTELRVELNNSWPDYVFNDTYKLPTIKEMEQHINQYKHLPGIPSAAQMESNGGFDVGVMQTKMMEKIEELSLYIIQLEKKIEKLEATHQ
ncbi:MAG TPA: hypothetical protein PLO59_01775, partial [Bacteroidia bacterium]|nr:hypothetical protein [Bacteroidia bacterium]